MAVLNFFIDKDDQSKVGVLLQKHEHEKETDLTYLWGKYALSVAIQLNFNEIKVNPFTEDQGAQIHFLSDQLRIDNNLNIYGYIKEDENNEFDQEDDDPDDFDLDDEFFQPTLDPTFEPDEVFNGAMAIRGKKEYVQIILDLHNATQVVGGLLTPTAVSANAVYEAAKKHAYEVSK